MFELFSNPYVCLFLKVVFFGNFVILTIAHILGAGLAIFGAIKNRPSRRPQYGQGYSPYGYGSGYTAPYQSHGYSPYQHASYPIHSQQSYPVYTQPAYPTRPFRPPSYPNPYAAGYGSGYPIAKSSEAIFQDHKSYEQIKKDTNPQGKDIAQTADKNTVLPSDATRKEYVENTKEITEVNGNKDSTSENVPTEAQQVTTEADDIKLPLYPALLEGPIIVPPQPLYILSNVNEYPVVNNLPSYHPTFLPISLNRYPYANMDYAPQQRHKRSSADVPESPKESKSVIESGSFKDANNPTNTSKTEHDELESDTKDDEGDDIETTESQGEENARLEQYIPPLPKEERKRKKKKPSKTALLATGAIAAAAGYALTNYGIKNYYGNRPTQYASQYPQPPQYAAQYPRPPQYAAQYPRPQQYPAQYPYGGHSSIGSGYHSIGSGYPSPSSGYNSGRPSYINNYPTRPAGSPHYYPFYRTIFPNNQELVQSLEGKEELSDTRSPWILISTQQNSDRRPNQFPYNQQYYYHHYPTNNLPEYLQLQKPSQQQQQQQQQDQNRYVYLYGYPIIQNQAVHTEDT